MSAAREERLDVLADDPLVQALIQGHRFSSLVVGGLIGRQAATRSKDPIPALVLHPDKTKLIRFTRPVGPSLGKGHDAQGRRPETFDLLGFTHYWGRSRAGYWVIKVKTSSKAMRRALTAVWQWSRRYRDMSVAVQHDKLTAKLRGLYQFYLRPANTQSLWDLRRKTERAWHYWLSRRSQKARLSRQRVGHLLKRYPLPKPLAQRAK